MWKTGNFLVLKKRVPKQLLRDSFFMRMSVR